MPVTLLLGYARAMSNEHPYRPCPSCGGVEFDSLPALGCEVMNANKAFTKIPGAQHLVVSLVVCSGCGKTDFYAKNAATFVQRHPDATHFRAAPQGSRPG